MYLCIYLSIYHLSIHSSILHCSLKLSLIICQWSNGSPWFLTLLRAYPRKGLVTQRPDEGPQITCLSVGTAQRWQPRSRKMSAPGMGKLGLHSSWLTVGKSFTPSTCQFPNNKMRFPSFSSLRSWSARTSCSLPLTSRLPPARQQQGWSQSPQ